MIRTDELDYELPPGMIATRPVEPRDSARMLVLWRTDPHRPIEHRLVRDLSDYLRSGDALIFNTTTVVPARLIGRRRGTGGRVEGLFLEDLPKRAGWPRWRVILKTGGRLNPGDRIELLDRCQQPSTCDLQLSERVGAQWIAELIDGGTTADALNHLGWTPLPPYILKARGNDPVSDDKDRVWYQTTYADSARAGSVAAPTAGLHFTPEILNRLRVNGIDRIDVTLHVGPGTFQPVTAETLDQHPMHSEHYEIDAAMLSKLRDVKARKRLGEASRIIAVGTTSVRTLESLPADALQRDSQQPITGETDLLIAPPYQFKVVDGMLSNFHLPRSTLLALVAAMIGLDRAKAVYQQAINHGYRFYSYGDAMLILP